MGLYRSRIEFLVMFEVVQQFIMKTSHKSDELKNLKRWGPQIAMELHRTLRL